jgi:hypothetical protein
MKTWLVIVLAGAISAGTALLVVRAMPEPPGSGSAGGEVGSVAEVEDLSRELSQLRHRVATLEGVVDRQAKELATARAALDDRAEAPGLAAPAPAVTQGVDDPSPRPENAPSDLDREALDAVAREVADRVRRARQQARDGIAALIANTPEYQKSQRDRAIRTATELAKRFKLPKETGTEIARSLWTQGQRTSESIRGSLAGRDLDKLTVQEVRPLIDGMFEARDQAVQPYLTPEQHEQFREAEAQSRRRYDDWLRLAFPKK